ncbi:MAG: 7-cyano-7-deazaguanine synthase, partial [Prevotellaceae bacterium]|nr:7-cyano-7-deazaguanine synthase [Prevotellaceae bacterium]
MKDCILILSGGMDSVTMLYEYRQRIAMAVTFNYGSKHNEKEIAFARLHCKRLGI